MPEAPKKPKPRAAKPREPNAKKKPANGEAAAKLDAMGIEAVCERLMEGDGYRAIAKSAGVSLGTFAAWLAASSERSARAREARKVSAETEDEQALKVLEDLDADPSPGAVAKAREIAQHRRWRAKVRDPERYGDRSTLDLNAKIENEDTGALLAELSRALGVSVDDARRMVGFAPGENAG